MGATANNFYFYLNVWISLMYNVLMGLIALVGTTMISTCYHLGVAAAVLLGLDFFDARHADRF